MVDSSDLTLLVGVLGVLFIIWRLLRGARLKREAAVAATGRGAAGAGAGAGAGSGAKPRRSAGFAPILDEFHSMEQVTKALRRAGLESSNLVVGVDFTKSNTWQGEKTFGGKCLHALSPTTDGLQNPYECAIQALGQCLVPFDDDGLIPAYGFGDAVTKGEAVFPLPTGSTHDAKPVAVGATSGASAEAVCNGFLEVLQAYRSRVPGVPGTGVHLAGPTNFAPLIQEAVRVTKAEGGFHILLIIADGQVSQPADTKRAIVAACAVPLAIVMVGVGDGPWDEMETYDDKLPARSWDNFQFVNFQTAWRGDTVEERRARFALQCLMEIPEQFRICRERGLLG